MDEGEGPFPELGRDEDEPEGPRVVHRQGTPRCHVGLPQELRVYLQRQEGQEVQVVEVRQVQVGREHHVVQRRLVQDGLRPESGPTTWRGDW